MEKYSLISQILLLIATSFCSWLFGKLQTKRERAKSDLEIIQAAITPQVESIQQLTAHNNQIIQMYLQEQKERIRMEGENKQLKSEKEDLSKKVSRLTLKVENLEKLLKKITDEKINGSTS